MKERMNNLIQSLQDWRGAIYLNVFFVGVHLVLLIVRFHIAYVAGVVFHLGMAMACYFLWQYERQHRSDQLRMLVFHDRWVHDHNIVVIYQKHYGGLTPEMQKDLMEGERRAIEESEKQNSEKP